MKKVFVDTAYLIAASDSRNWWHKSARKARANLGDAQLITTDEVLSEFLTFFSRRGPHFRHAAVRIVDAVLGDKRYKVFHQSHESFLTGLQHYRNRSDKNYSLQDCISMCVMRRESILEVLTSDSHFEQEGYVILLK